MSDAMPKDLRWPKLSIVTPSFNQGFFLEETVRSVLSQEYPNLEYIIIDGGSTDSSVDILRKWEPWLTYWVSEPDNGQYDAINKGFSKTTGEIMAWINSDDKYVPWAFSIVAEIFAMFPQIEWLTTAFALNWDKEGRAVSCYYQEGYSRHAFLRGANFPGREWYSATWIQQESTFWRRSLWERAGGHLDASMKMAGDFDLWARFFNCAELYTVSTPLAGFRSYGNQKTAHYFPIYLEEAEQSFRHNGGHPYGRLESYMRRCFLRIRGRASFGLRYCPPLARALITRSHLLYPVKRCIWTHSGWRIDDAYIV